MTAAKWVDPDPIRVASAHGLAVLLYRRRPADDAERTGERQPQPPVAAQSLGPQDWQRPLWVQDPELAARLQAHVDLGSDAS